MNKYQKEYVYRINRVTDYIDAHIDQELSLDELAAVANFSPFHFHRIFTAFTGETLNNFVKRLRVEKAAGMLLSDTDRPVSEVAMECGFSSAAVFCRMFKAHYSQSAVEFRKTAGSKYSKNGQSKSKSSKPGGEKDAYVCRENKPQKRRPIMTKNFEIKDMEAMPVIYCRHTGRFDQIGSAYEKLFKWAGPRGLLSSPGFKCITYYHDDPKVTDPEKIRQSACLTIDRDIRTEGEIGKMVIPGERYFVCHFEIRADEFQEAWDNACLWLSESGYLPADGSPLEICHNDHQTHPEKKFIVDICIPVKLM
jgi:AraC family transcriptional regulator